MLAWGGALLGVGTPIVGIMAASRSFGRAWEYLALLIPVGIFVMIGAGIFAAIALPILKPKRIDEQYAYFTGADESVPAAVSGCVMRVR